MADDEKAIERIVLTELMRLNAGILGLIFGLILGGGIFLVTNFLILKGGPNVGEHLWLLGQFFIGYRVTFLGSLVGLAYGFAVGFVLGYLVGFVYNKLADWRTGQRR
jgi:hypothetical protein